MAIQDSFNQLVGTVAGAAVSAKHLANQEKANEMNYVRQKGENSIKSVDLEAEQIDYENKLNTIIPAQLEHYKREENQTLQDLKQGLTDTAAANKAFAEIEEKTIATYNNRAHIQGQLAVLQEKQEALKNNNFLLDKQNPKLKKKYENFGGNK